MQNCLSMKRPRLNPRKLLVASVGVATVNYALAAGCGGNKGPNISVVANLMPGPPGFELDPGTPGTGGSFPGTVANLVAPPPPVSPSPVRFEPPDAGAPDASSRAAAPSDAG